MRGNGGERDIGGHPIGCDCHIYPSVMVLDDPWVERKHGTFQDKMDYDCVIDGVKDMLRKSAL